jgi:hypothetical protein
MGTHASLGSDNDDFDRSVTLRSKYDKRELYLNCPAHGTSTWSRVLGILSDSVRNRVIVYLSSPSMRSDRRRKPFSGCGPRRSWEVLY